MRSERKWGEGRLCRELGITMNISMALRVTYILFWFHEFSPALLRYDLHKTLCKFKVYDVIMYCEVLTMKR